MIAFIASQNLCPPYQWSRIATTAYSQQDLMALTTICLSTFGRTDPANPKGPQPERFLKRLMKRSYVSLLADSQGHIAGFYFADVVVVPQLETHLFYFDAGGLMPFIRGRGVLANAQRLAWEWYAAQGRVTRYFSVRSQHPAILLNAYQMGEHTFPFDERYTTEEGQALLHAISNHLEAGGKADAVDTKTGITFGCYGQRLGDSAEKEVAQPLMYQLSSWGFNADNGDAVTICVRVDDPERVGPIEFPSIAKAKAHDVAE